MEVQDLGSSSDLSSDNELIQELRNAGLMLKNKLKKENCKDHKNKIKLDFNQPLDLDSVDINTLLFLEKDGENFTHLPHQPIVTDTVVTEYQSSDLTILKDIAINSSKTSSQYTPPGGVFSINTPPKVVILNDVPYHGDLVINKKRNNKATKDPSQYKRNLNKDLRMKGENYLGYRRDRKAKQNEKFKVKQDVFKPARSIQPPCISSFCKKSKLRACDIISEEQRRHLFTTFWKTMNWDQRRSFICSHVIKVDKKVTKNPDTKRNESRAYVFTIDNKRFQVCKKMFLATLGIKDWFVRYWLQKTECAMPPPHLTFSTSNRREPKKIQGHKYLENYLLGLPKMPSHYCRASTSREYLEPVFPNMTQLYSKYKESCEFESEQIVGRKLFDQIFKKLNLSLFPKKDQCDVCCSHKTGNITDEEYVEHISKKDRARKEKDADKSTAQSGAYHVFTQDVQAVKLAPYLQASAIYYKTKLCVHNFTLYNLATKEVMCYWFDETNSTLEASAFASCLVDHLSIILSRKLLPVILFSDGCCAQNRNVTLSNALLRLSVERNIAIKQKYLVKGHTHMECDSVHSAIECKLKGKEIYLPKQYVSISKTARVDMPYQARLLEYTFFTDFSKDLIYKSIRPGRKAGDPVVTDLSVLEYRPDGTIWYKTDFDQEHLQPLPHRPTPINLIKPINQMPKLYTTRIPITKRKYQDLQDLKSVLPSSCHSFYDELPYTK